MNKEPEAPSKAGLISWAFYDWANSSFSTVIQTFIFAAYFIRQVAHDTTVGSALWGWVIGGAGIVIAVLAPFLGAAADQCGHRKGWLGAFTVLAIVCMALLASVSPHPDQITKALILVFLGTIGAEIVFIFYNAMLPTLVPVKHIGRWSGWGWGMGYAGGMICLTLCLVLFILPKEALFTLNATDAEPVRASFILAAVWYLIFSLPLFFFTPSPPATGKPFLQGIREGVHQLVKTLKEVRNYRHLAWFLLARMFFIDGMATLFAFGGVYAAGTFNFTESEVLLYGIATNISAGIGAMVLGYYDDKIGSKRMILLSLVGLILFGICVLAVETIAYFLVFSLCLTLFVGPVQASSRSYLARLAPAHLRNQVFGFFALSGKATAFIGPILVGWLTLLSGSQRVGLSTIIVFFVLGLALMCKVKSD